MGTHSRDINLTQAGIGLLALVLGVVLYLLDRPAAQTYFVPEAMSFFHHSPKFFGAVGNHLPTFLHAFAFSLITCGVFSVGRRQALGICVLWLLIDGAFEIGQQPEIANVIAEIVPDWFARIPILENTRDYFLHGRFDPLDLLSIVLGGGAAYGVVMATRRTVSTQRRSERSE